MTVELREICERRGAAIQALGSAVAIELAQRIADIVELKSVAELAALLPDDLADRSPSEKVLRLESPTSLVFCSGHVKTPLKSDGEIDWNKVSRIRITAIEARNG